jgi:alpha-galactosidase
MIQASLSFDGDKASMRIGAEDLPVFDVSQLGHDVGFTVVVPGTPYLSVRYSGVLAEDMMQLSSLDEGRGVFTLQARRADRNALPAPGPPTAQRASLSPPPAARVQPPPRPPSPTSARPIPQSASAPSAPPVKLPLPALRDLPPNGLAAIPIMGWSSRQKLGSRTDEAAIRKAVEGLVESGLNLIGYVYVEIGDGWQGARDAQGVLHPNERFPDMKALGDYIHSQGLKFGLTASAAPKSCNGLEGSHGHEEQDARTFAEWGVDYVVYEWCGAETIYPTQSEMQAVFQKMGEALRASGRDMVYAISQKGQFGVEQWASKTGANMWRTGNELEENWESIAAAGFSQNGKEGAAKPGAWNDPGLLQTGNGIVIPDESRMQLNLWSVLAAPLMLGNDVRIMTREAVALLSNREVIAVNQDRLGRQGRRVAQSADTQVWAKPLADGSVAVAFFNTGTRTTSVAVTWEQLGINGPHLARDLWWRENLGIANNSYRVVLTGGTSMLLKFSR